MGCDAALKGLAFVSYPSLEYVWIKRPKNSDLQFLLTFYFEQCNNIECDAVFLEDVPFVRNVRATIELAQILGIIRLSFLLRGIPVTMANVSSWKKQTVGFGNAKKEQIRDFVRESPLFEGLPKTVSSDVADAACIALFGNNIMEKEKQNG